MKPRDAFGVVVRSIGLVILLYTLRTIVLMIGIGDIGFSLKLLVFSIIPTAALGFWMLTGAPLIVDIAYLRDEDSSALAKGSRRKPDTGDELTHDAE
jgi:hypothetical protein